MTSDILFVLPELSQTVGGVHTVIDLCRELNTRGIKAQCLVLGKLTDAECAAFKEPLPEGGLLHASHWLRFVFETPVQPKLVVSTFFATALPAFLFSRLKGVPHIHYVQGNEFLFDNGRLHAQVADAYGFADEMVATSPWLLEAIQRHAPQKTATLLPLGIDLARCKPADRAAGARPRLGVILRSGPDKGQAILLETLQHLAGNRDQMAVTALLSPGYELPRAWAEATDTQVLQLPVDRATLARQLQGCDIVVDASLHEGFGLLPLEAMACGAVPVVSDSGGVRQYCNERNSIIVTAVNQPEEFANAIRLLLADQSRRSQLRAAALETATGYALPSALDKYAAFFRERLAAGAAKRGDELTPLRNPPSGLSKVTRDALQTFFSIHDKQKTIEDVLPSESYKQSGGYGFYSALKGILPLRLRRALYYLIVNPKE